jgi:hypothetical protein
VRTYAALAGRVEACAPGFHHKGIVDRHDEHVAGVFELGVADVAWDVCARASGAYIESATDHIYLVAQCHKKQAVWRRTKSSRNSNDNALLQLLGEIDLVARRVLEQLDVGDRIADLDKGRTSGVEKRRLGAELARRGSCEAAGGEHCRWLCFMFRTRLNCVVLCCVVVKFGVELLSCLPHFVISFTEARAKRTGNGSMYRFKGMSLVTIISLQVNSSVNLQSSLF